jgi:hypothetical protein
MFTTFVGVHIWEHLQPEAEEEHPPAGPQSHLHCSGRTEDKGKNKETKIILKNCHHFIQQLLHRALLFAFVIYMFSSYITHYSGHHSDQQIQAQVDCYSYNYLIFNILWTHAR